MRAPVEPPEAFPFNAPPELEPLREESDSPSNEILSTTAPTSATVCKKGYARSFYGV